MNRHRIGAVWQYGTVHFSCLFVYVRGTIYGLCGSRNFRQFKHPVAVFTANSDWQCWSLFSIGLYGSKTNFSLPFIKYSSQLQTVSEKKFPFDPSTPIRTIIFYQEVSFMSKGRETAFLSYQPMQFGTSISVFHVRSATAESAVISRPAYSVLKIFKKHAPAGCTGPKICAPRHQNVHTGCNGTLNFEHCWIMIKFQTLPY